MIKPEQVPDEVWTQVALRLESAGAVVSDQVAKLVAADAINVWPGMIHGKYFAEPSIILPLLQENSNDQ